MNRPRRRRRIAATLDTWRRVKGLMLVEVVVATAVVGVLLVAALNTVAAARMSEYKLAERNRGLLLAQALLAEILEQAYADPQAGPGSFGVDLGEGGPGNRSLYDDVDDYDGWTACPPQNKDGSVIPGCADYEQSVNVNWVNPANLDQTAMTDTGVKRVRVTLSHQGRVVIILTAYRTQVWLNPADIQGS